MKIKNTIKARGKSLVCRIYDLGLHGPFDRYTIAFKGYRVQGLCMVYPYLASSDNPYSPQGFGQHGESKKFMTGRHLGKRVSFDAVPSEVQRFILDNI